MIDLPVAADMTPPRPELQVLRPLLPFSIRMNARRNYKPHP
jgi:hypothetical protein